MYAQLCYFLLPFSLCVGAHHLHYTYRIIKIANTWSITQNTYPQVHAYPPLSHSLSNTLSTEDHKASSIKLQLEKIR